MNYVKMILVAFATLVSIGCSTPVSPSASPSQSTSASHQKIDLYAVYKNGCEACVFMKKSMQDPQVQALLTKEFNVHISDIKDKDSLPKAWMRPAYSPTFYFLDSNQKELISSINAQSPSQLLATLKSAVEARDLK